MTPPDTTSSHINTNTTHSELEERPLPPVPARSKTSFFGYANRTQPDDIESALERYDAHRPNRFIGGLWHANNAGNGNAAGTH
ncbi:MAG: hypothetical protein Q9174_003108, partial [Haloplaca sp. 1 TL-2023]